MSNFDFRDFRKSCFLPESGKSSVDHEFSHGQKRSQIAGKVDESVLRGRGEGVQNDLGALEPVLGRQSARLASRLVRNPYPAQDGSQSDLASFSGFWERGGSRYGR